MREIPNKTVLGEMIAGVTPAENHAALRFALAERYPDLEWHFGHFTETWYREDQRVWKHGQLVADNVKAWKQGLVDAAGGDFRAAWRAHREQGYAQMAEKGTTLFAAAQMGPRVEDVLTLKIDYIYGAEVCAVFEDATPSERQDFDTPCCRERVGWKADALARPRYDLRRMSNIARVLALAEELEMQHRRDVVANHKVMVSTVILDSFEPAPEPAEKSVLELDPDYFKRAIRERRFLADWQASSAGQNASLLDHWGLDVHDYEWKGERQVGITPRPLTWAEEIEHDGDRSLYQLMDLLERFDAEAGYPMAWFFHAVYGARLGGWAIEAVADGLKRSKIGLPEKDAQVVRAWAARLYAF